MKRVFIYGLYTNSSDDIRYVGKCNDLEQRLKMHYSQRNTKKTHKNNWINRTIRDGFELRIKILEITDDENWREVERRWISKLENLTNTSSGGLGGSGKKYNINYIDCKNLVKEYNIYSKSKWVEFTKDVNFPTDIPRNPVQYFKNEWLGWGDFLGTNRKQDNLIADNYISYEEAKEWIKKNLKIKSFKDWRSKIELIPTNIPNRPERFYKKRGWISWSDFLNKKRVANKKRNIIPYSDAKVLINNLNITSMKEYKKIQMDMYINELPVYPHLTYKNKGFKSYEEFFKGF